MRSRRMSSLPLWPTLLTQYAWHRLLSSRVLSSERALVERKHGVKASTWKRNPEGRQTSVASMERTSSSATQSGPPRPGRFDSAREVSTEAVPRSRGNPDARLLSDDRRGWHSLCVPLEASIHSRTERLADAGAIR